jgi:NAD(P)-dependent dehydrogenase (short-subunit alcohol dehydrogenase family)
MQVAVIGASGGIGRELIPRFADPGYDRIGDVPNESQFDAVRARGGEARLSMADWNALERVRDHFKRAILRRPRTREGTAERMAAGFTEKYRRVVDRLTDETPSVRRCVSHYVLRDVRCLGHLIGQVFTTNPVVVRGRLHVDWLLVAREEIGGAASDSRLRVLVANPF